MAYSQTDLTELIRYHLVLSEDDPERADDNLIRLVGEIAEMATRPLWRAAEWVFCDRCGTSVDTDLIHPEGHHFAADGDFLCADCWYGEDADLDTA
jgi:hypothetical protein